MNSPASTSSRPETNPATTPRRTIGSLLLGLVFIFSGIFAILAPLVSTLAMTLVAGVSLVAAGAAQIVHAFSKGWGGFLLQIALGLVYVIGGVAFWLNPLAGALVITLLLAWILIAHGAGEIVLGFRIRRTSGWIWLIVAGLVAIAAGAWLLLRLNIAGLFVPGTILGISLLFEGWAFVVLGRSPRSEGIADEAGQAGNTIASTERGATSA